MGHYEYEWEDYNPVTDVWRRGPATYVEDEYDRQEARERKAKAQEPQDIRSYIWGISDPYDFSQIRSREDRINNSRYLDYNQKVSLRRELEYHVEHLKKRNLERQLQAAQREREDKSIAFQDAKKRYKNLSIFGKIKHFGKRPSKLNYREQTIEDLEQLYRRR